MQHLKTLKNILHYRSLPLIIITLLFCLLTLNQEPKTKYNLDEQYFVGTIQKITKEQDRVQFVLKAKEKILVNYYIQNENFNYQLGDMVKVSGKLSLPKSRDNFNLFDYRNYLKSQNIFYILDLETIGLVESNKNIFYKVKNYIISRLDNRPNQDYLKAFILGDTSDIGDDILESYKVNGISHLLAISGMHIGFISQILYIFLKNVRQSAKKFIVITFLLFFSFLVNFSPSVMRSIIFMILSLINKKCNYNIKSIDLFIILTCGFLMLNPYHIYNTGFLYSFIISGFLIYYQNKFQSGRYILDLVKMSLIAFLVSFPITIYNSFEINLMSPLLNVLFVPFVSIIVFPLAFIVFLFPIFSPIYSFLIWLLETLSVMCLKLDWLTFALAKPSFFILVLYYLIVIYVLNNPKKVWLLLLVFLIHPNIHKLNFDYKITSLSVGQGDSILIEFPHDQGNVLIDTGGSVTSHGYVGRQIVIPYLKSIGINKLDYLIITHGDYDHMGEAINLVNNFKVEKVIFNCGEFNELEQELIRVLDKKKIPYYSCVKELNIDDNKLYFLNNGDYGNENDNSSVIYTKLNNYKFLFMGDAGVEVEKDLIKKYDLQNIDILKVGHHGSRTSSSELFINEVNPKYSIISVGKNNRYGHPNKEVLENLKDSKIYRTDREGSIMFRINNIKFKVETCIP